MNTTLFTTLFGGGGKMNLSLGAYMIALQSQVGFGEIVPAITGVALFPMACYWQNPT